VAAAPAPAPIPYLGAVEPEPGLEASVAAVRPDMNEKQAARWMAHALRLPDRVDQLISYFEDEDIDGEAVQSKMKKPRRLEKLLCRALSVDQATAADWALRLQTAATSTAASPAPAPAATTPTATTPAATTPAPAPASFLSSRLRHTPPRPSKGEENIKQRLDRSEWKTYETGTDSQWWQTETADKIHRLRAAARVYEAFGQTKGIRSAHEHPQLVVLGDGNTGKSSVLNRFTEFWFSAVTDGVCTRRPVKLQLRPVSSRNRSRVTAEELLAIYTIHDTEDQFTHEFFLRDKFREQDETTVRRAIEDRAQGKTGPGMASQYMMEELIITIEAPQMIYLDLLDLPGVENQFPAVKQMVRRYINADTLERTFVLVFEGGKFDTELNYRCGPSRGLIATVLQGTR
jgi:hypothetical protein